MGFLDKVKEKASEALEQGKDVAQTQQLKLQLKKLEGEVEERARRVRRGGVRRSTRQARSRRARPRRGRGARPRRAGGARGQEGRDRGAGADDDGLDARARLVS